MDTQRSVIWFSDLREGPASGAEAVACLVPAIGRHGGRVLTTRGANVVAIFPITEAGDAGATRVCDLVIEAAEEAFEALAGLNERRVKDGAPALRIGLSLHVGDGRDGGPGMALAAGLEGLTARLPRRLVVSAEFARLTSRTLTNLGSFEIHGMSQPETVFAPISEG